MDVPSISIVSGLYNTDLTLWKKTLTGIREQHYPRTRIEHIVMDAGSTNGADRLARQFGCTVISRPDLIHRGSVRMSLGISRAKNELILILEPDNIMVGHNWLREMVKPFIEQSQVCAAFSMYNSFEKKMPVLTRYTALIGTSDPTLFYLNRSEKMPRYKKHYDLGEILENRLGYYVVRFTKGNLPTLGDNGHMVKRSIIRKVNTDENKFLHIQAFAELLALGFDTYAVVKNSIIHYNGSNVLELVSRRVSYKQSYYDANRGKRTYYVFDYHSPQDVRNLLWYILYSLTFVQPFIISIRGYLSLQDIAWLLHPVVSFCTVVGYGWSEFKRIMTKKYF